LQAAENAQRVHGWHEWCERSSRPSQQLNEGPCEPRSHPANVAADVDTKTHLRKREHAERCGEEESEKQERDADDLALEGAAQVSCR